MLPRERKENMESSYLSPFAVCSKETKGRQIAIEKCPIRTDFQRDRDRIIHCNSFRRLKHKTQVFLIPTGDHYRTRLTHTLEVSQIARTISSALCLNEDLTEAIALGHDLGHTPFGHAGERALNDVCEQGFKHYEQSLRVVDFIENDGKGLNLTYEVRDGILKHTNKIAETKEGYIVRLSDVIAYINHDIDDAIRAEIISENDLPEFAVRILGKTKSKRITTLVEHIINNGCERLDLFGDYEKAHNELKSFMFERVYRNNTAKSQEGKAISLVQRLYEHYYKNPDEMPDDFKALSERFGKSTAVCDYVAGMTDSYAIRKYNDLFIPLGWNK